MKKQTVPFLSLIALIATGGMLTGCGETDDPNTLHIVALNASYGSAWIESAKQRFESKHEGIKVDLHAIYEADELIQSHLYSSNNTDDLYICVGSEWKSYAAQGYFAELDSFLDETIDGKKIKDKVSEEYQNSLYFTKSDGTKHCYRLPWTSGIGGIYYNKKLFSQNGWDTYLKTTFSANTSGVPETTEQLTALCAKILSDQVPVAGDGMTAVKPFIFTGTNTDYFDYTVFSWWAQIAGKEAIEEFLKYESADNFDVTKNPTYAALKQATNYWNSLFGNSANYVTGSGSKTAGVAQKEFVNGYAAMMFNGDWLYNDVLYYMQNSSFQDKFELGLMKTPMIDGGKETYRNHAYVIGEDQYIAIPRTSTKQDLAKEFIREIISDEGCTSFANEAHAFLAYDADYDTAKLTDSFVKETLTLRKDYTEKFTNHSDNRKYLCNYLDIWCTSASRPFSNLLNGTVTVDAAFQNISRTASANWTDWTNKSR